MLSHQSVLVISATAWLMVVATDAWTGQEGKVTRLSIPLCSTCMIRQDTGTIHDAEGSLAMIRDRRKFLWQSAVMLLPVVTHAEDETVQVSNPPPLEEKAATLATEQLLPTVDEARDSAEKRPEENMVKEEKELVAELVKEESEEEKAIEDTQKLINKLEEQIKDEANDDSKPDEQKLQSNKNLIDTLEKEEERIESETKEIIAKIETLEKETSPAAPENITTEEFLNKLKERVGEKEDLITRLKRESEKDIDPKTGKFKTMTSKEFKARAPSDFDFLGYLKESVTNTEEFERDLDAFKGLLESKFGPVIEEVRKVSK